MKFGTHRGKDGQWRWNAKAKNGLIVADGAEGYVSRANARRAMLRFMEGCFWDCALQDGEPLFRKHQLPRQPRT